MDADKHKRISSGHAFNKAFNIFLMLNIAGDLPAVSYEYDIPVAHFFKAFSISVG